jgi:hypothetical protein
MEEEMDTLEAARAELSEKIAGRRKILKALPKRAYNEAPLLYSRKAIEAAMTRGNNQQQPQPAAPSPRATK